MNTVGTIARAEIAYLLRSRLALVSGLFFGACLIFAALTSTLFLAEERHHREAHQAEAEQIFESQPDRHPHRMVHYGQYVFRTPPPLAAIDPGLDAYGGTSVFLEGHRQNAAMFAGASEAATLVRFGSLTPAFILQEMAPLLLILIGHGAMTREREAGTLRALVAQGVTTCRLARGKLRVLLMISGLCLFILAITASGPVFAGEEGPLAAALLILSYGLYLALWALVVVAVSALMKSSGSAFIVLASFWLATTVIVPRVAADLASTTAPLKSAFARDMELRAAIHALGDSHDPSDPTFGPFLKKTLAQYNVERIEDLPVNYRGLLAVEGERLGAAVIQQFNNEDIEARTRQKSRIAISSVISPFVAIQSASQSLAGTDLSSYHGFLAAAETHRLAFVQALNMLQATEVDYQLDRIKSVDVQAERATRVSADVWATLPEFEYSVAPEKERLKRAVPLLAILTLWLVFASAGFLWATKRPSL